MLAIAEYFSKKRCLILLNPVRQRKLQIGPARQQLDWLYGMPSDQFQATGPVPR